MTQTESDLSSFRYQHLAALRPAKTIGEMAIHSHPSESRSPSLPAHDVDGGCWSTARRGVSRYYSKKHSKLDAPCPYTLEAPHCKTRSAARFGAEPYAFPARNRGADFVRTAAKRKLSRRAPSRRSWGRMTKIVESRSLHFPIPTLIASSRSFCRSSKIIRHGAKLPDRFGAGSGLAAFAVRTDALALERISFADGFSGGTMA